MGSGKANAVTKKDYQRVYSYLDLSKARFSEGITYQIALKLPVTKIERLSLFDPGFRRLLFNNGFWKAKLIREGQVLWHDGVSNFYLYYLMIRPRGGFLKYENSDNQLRDQQRGERKDIGKRCLVDYDEREGREHQLTETGILSNKQGIIDNEVKAMSCYTDCIIYLKFDGRLIIDSGKSRGVIRENVQELDYSYLITTSGELFQIDLDWVDADEFDKVMFLVIPFEKRVCHLNRCVNDTLVTTTDRGLYTIDENQIHKIGDRYISGTSTPLISMSGGIGYLAIDGSGRLWSNRTHFSNIIPMEKWERKETKEPIVWVMGKESFSINNIGGLTTKDPVYGSRIVRSEQLGWVASRIQQILEYYPTQKARRDAS